MKNNNFLRFLINMLQIIMKMTVAVAVVNFILHGFMHYETFQAANTFYIAVVVLVCYFARVFIKNGKVVFAIHVLAAISPIFVVNGILEDKLLVFVPASVLAYYSMKKSNQKPFIQLDMSLLVVCYIVGNTLVSESAFVVPMYCTIIYLVSYMIWYNINNLDEFIAENGKVKSFNTEQFINMNSVLLSIFVVLCAATMFIMPRIHLQEGIWAVVRVILSGLLVIVRQFTKYLPKGGKELEESLESVITRDEEVGELPVGLGISEGNDILDMIMFVFAFVIAASMIVLLIKALKDIRYKQNRGVDVKEFIKPVFKPNFNFTKQDKENIVDDGPDNIKVRKMYRRLIKKNIKKKEKVSLNVPPSQLSAIVVNDVERSEKLTEIYEKARYSNNQVQAEDVEFVKKL